MHKCDLKIYSHEYFWIKMLWKNVILFLKNACQLLYV